MYVKMVMCSKLQFSLNCIVIFVTFFIPWTYNMCIKLLCKSFFAFASFWHYCTAQFMFMMHYWLNRTSKNVNDVSTDDFATSENKLKLSCLRVFLLICRHLRILQWNEIKKDNVCLIAHRSLFYRLIVVVIGWDY